jgi:transposase
LVDLGYPKHFRVNHSADEFANDDSNINGIESFGRVPNDACKSSKELRKILLISI